jgi:class 3 adenylate cyclase
MSKNESGVQSFAALHLGDDMNDNVTGGAAAAFSLPTGTVTFLLTDVEGSTAAWERAPELMGPAISRHYVLLDAAIVAHGGVRPVE